MKPFATTREFNESPEGETEPDDLSLERKNFIPNPFRTDTANELSRMTDQQLKKLKPVVKKLFSEYLQTQTKPTVPNDRRIKEHRKLLYLSAGVKWITISSICIYELSHGKKYRKIIGSYE